jgi:hypothetical protein
MAKAAKQIVFSRSRDIPFNKHHAAVPADAVDIDRGSRAIRIDNNRTGSSRLKRIGSPTSTVSSRSTSSPAAIFVCFCLSRPGHGGPLLRLANAIRGARIAWWRTVNVAA